MPSGKPDSPVKTEAGEPEEEREALLRLSASAPKYMYLRTRREFEKAVAIFEKSKFQYLHISCNGDPHSIALTLDNLSFDELGEILAPALKGRRVFFSSCSVTNAKCAASLFSETGCISAIGPCKKIEFDRATIFWSAFYHLMLRDDASAMKFQQMRDTVSSLKKIFGVHMRYFTKSHDASDGFRQVDL